MLDGARNLRGPGRSWEPLLQLGCADTPTAKLAATNMPACCPVELFLLACTSMAANAAVAAVLLGICGARDDPSIAIKTIFFYYENKIVCTARVSLAWPRVYGLVKFMP
jgi:hypothetical protein